VGAEQVEALGGQHGQETLAVAEVVGRRGVRDTESAGQVTEAQVFGSDLGQECSRGIQE
jgi:hypothetical protein